MLLRRAILPMLPSLRSIIDADETVDEMERLSVEPLARGLSMLNRPDLAVGGRVLEGVGEDATGWVAVAWVEIEDAEEASAAAG